MGRIDIIQTDSLGKTNREVDGSARFPYLTINHVFSACLIVKNAITNRMNDVMSGEFAKFQELENKIRNLIEEYALLRKKNHELEELLKSKGLELEGANNKIRGLNEERNSIRTKVDSLLDLLQDINVH